MKNNKKGFTLVEIMIVVVIIGLLAAMAIPAFQKVRENSQEKTILNNLRQVAGAGQQYLLEEGGQTVAFTALEGTYFPTIVPVNEEEYDDIEIEVTGGTISATPAGGNEVIFTY